MSFADNLLLLACAGVLALALLVAVRGGKTALALPIALPLVLLSVDVVCWNFSDLAFRTTGGPGWHWLEVGAFPMCAPLTLHFVAAFTGRVRTWRPIVVGSYVLFGALALVSSAASLSPWLAALTGSGAWTDGIFAGAIATGTLSLVLLVRHLRSASDPGERARTQLFLLALGVAAALEALDFASSGFALLHFGRFGYLLGVAIAALVTLRLGLFEKDLPTSAAAEAVVLAAVAFAGYLVAFELLRQSGALLTLAVGLVTVGLFGALRYAFGAFSVRRERIERLVTLGTFSAQLAHDLKNPLAALKGAAQFLREEWARGRSGPGQEEYFDLIVAQADRLGRTIDRYQRLGGLSPVRVPLSLNDLVRDALGLQRFAAQQISVQAELGADLPQCLADRDLLGIALDNLLRNALEAMPEGGTLTVRTARGEARQGDEVRLSVQDTGCGMSPRTRERAFDGFFTTKAQGSGLGLAFVRRVADAHGGNVSLTSEVGRGTIVRFSLPVV